MMEFRAYTDGACSANGTKSACAMAAVVLIALNGETVLKTRELVIDVPGEQTSNRAELFAVIAALEALTKPDTRILIVTDSNYVHMTLHGWAIRKGVQ